MINISADFGRRDMTAVVITERDEDGHTHVLHAWQGSGEPPAWFLVRREDRTDLVSGEAVQLEWWLRREHVSPEIIERVLRLNPDGGERYMRLRGFHRKERGRHLMHMNGTSKGEIIRRFGREVFDRIPRCAYIKCGRRIFVSGLDIHRANTP